MYFRLALILVTLNGLQWGCLLILMTHIIFWRAFYDPSFIYILLFLKKLGTFGKTFLLHSPDHPPSNGFRGRVWYDGLCMTQSYTVLLHEPLLNILWSVNHSSEDTITADLTRFWTKYNQIIEKRMVWAQSKGQIWHRYTEKPTNLSLTAKENNCSYMFWNCESQLMPAPYNFELPPLQSKSRKKKHITQVACNKPDFTFTFQFS